MGRVPHEAIDVAASEAVGILLSASRDLLESHPTSWHPEIAEGDPNKEEAN
jgi:hypothetical protein